jgi:HlyD family secretion protein
VARVEVRRGEVVRKGQILARMDRSDAEIAVAQAEAELAQAESQLSNISSGARAEEIAVIDAALNSALAQAEESARELKRQADLLVRGATPRAAYEVAETKDAIAQAKVSELRANLTVARLPARADEIRAAQAAVARARAVGRSAGWRLLRRELRSEVNGRVIDVIRHEGEIAGPQAPVLMLLPDGAVKLRLYLPEAEMARVAVGTALAVSCDNCPAGIAAEVSYISPGPEFTPPVIYSLENRQKLVYLIEARVTGGADLRPGQIVSVDLVADPS